jgi:putative endonuclease
MRRSYLELRSFGKKVSGHKLIFATEQQLAKTNNPKNERKNWVVYLVRCAGNSLYCGITNNLSDRLMEHNSGKGAKYTRSRRPVELLGVSPEMTKSDALKLEYKIKQLPPEKKLFQLTEKENVRTIKQDLKWI